MVCSPEQAKLNGTRSNGPITERGKAIASRNATKHGLLAKQPPLLVTEDLASFQGLLQGLVDHYQPVGPLEWHWVQTIAMCIQKQHRVWAAEAALGNAQTLPEAIKVEKYPEFKQEEGNENWSEYHPQNLAKEQKLLIWFLEQTSLEHFPTASRSKYWPEDWSEWLKQTYRAIDRVVSEYPVDGLAGRPPSTLKLLNPKAYSERFQYWFQDLSRQGHPYAKLLYYKTCLSDSTDPPSAKLLQFYKEEHQGLLQVCQRRLDAICQIEQERQQAQQRYEAEVAQRKALTASPVSFEAGLIIRYEAHNSRQLQLAIEQLLKLQQERKNGSSMGSFGKDTRSLEATESRS